MIGPLIKLKLGDYLYRTSGFLSSVTIAVDANSPWEINLEEMEEYSRDYIEESKLVIKFECREIGVNS